MRHLFGKEHKEQKSLKLVKKLQLEEDQRYQQALQERQTQEEADAAFARQLQAELEAETNGSSSPAAAVSPISPVGALAPVSPVAAAPSPAPRPASSSISHTPPPLPSKPTAYASGSSSTSLSSLSAERPSSSNSNSSNVQPQRDVPPPPYQVTPRLPPRERVASMPSSVAANGRPSSGHSSYNPNLTAMTPGLAHSMTPKPFHLNTPQMYASSAATAAPTPNVAPAAAAATAPSSSNSSVTPRPRREPAMLIIPPPKKEKQPPSSPVQQLYASMPMPEPVHKPTAPIATHNSNNPYASAPLLPVSGPNNTNATNTATSMMNYASAPMAFDYQQHQPQPTNAQFNPLAHSHPAHPHPQQQPLLPSLQQQPQQPQWHPPQQQHQQQRPQQQQQQQQQHQQQQHQFQSVNASMPASSSFTSTTTTTSFVEPTMLASSFAPTTLTPSPFMGNKQPGRAKSKFEKPNSTSTTSSPAPVPDQMDFDDDFGFVQRNGYMMDGAVEKIQRMTDNVNSDDSGVESDGDDQDDAIDPFDIDPTTDNVIIHQHRPSNSLDITSSSSSAGAAMAQLTRKSSKLSLRQETYHDLLVDTHDDGSDPFTDAFAVAGEKVEATPLRHRRSASAVADLGKPAFQMNQNVSKMAVVHDPLLKLAAASASTATLPARPNSTLPWSASSASLNNNIKRQSMAAAIPRPATAFHYPMSSAAPPQQHHADQDLISLDPIPDNVRPVQPTNVVRAGAPPNLQAMISQVTAEVPANEFGYYRYEIDKPGGEKEEISDDYIKELPTLPELPKTDPDHRHITVPSVIEDQRVWIRVHPTDTGKSLASRIQIVAAYKTRKVTKITSESGRVVPLDDTALFPDWADVMRMKDGAPWKVEWVPVDQSLWDGPKEFVRYLKSHLRGSSNN
ncbi:hypothetical protein BC940DRAFT_311413 [Gongronella butleri]|nr:hypothetical protein BC940DRAFT_311413 [Gongronella butleri]